jgi:hypothetical protein
VAQLVRLVQLVGRRCHNAARLVRLADGRVAARLVDSSDSSDSVGRRCHDAARLVRLADGRVAARLVDSSDSSAELAAAKSAAAEPAAAEPTSIEPTLDHTTTLGGGDYDYDQTYDDIGGIYDSCDDYNYDSDPADDI